jgi:hypothetical protein
VVPIVCPIGSEEEIERSIVASGAIDGRSVVVFVSVSRDLQQSQSNYLTLRRLE